MQMNRHVIMYRREVRTFVALSCKEALFCADCIVTSAYDSITQHRHGLYSGCDVCIYECMKGSNHTHSSVHQTIIVNHIFVGAKAWPIKSGEENVFISPLITAISSLWHSNDVVNTAALIQT